MYKKVIVAKEDERGGPIPMVLWGGKDSCHFIGDESSAKPRQAAKENNKAHTRISRS